MMRGVNILEPLSILPAEARLDWPTFHAEIERLADKIDYQPEVIVAVARGGVVPGILLSKELSVEPFLSLKVKKIGEKRRILAEIFTDLENKKVLLVDDMIETGFGFQAAKEYLEKKGAQVKTACLYTMPFTQVLPDYFLHQVPQVTKFPWD